jgi:hypothetical protein
VHKKQVTVTSEKQFLMRRMDISKGFVWKFPREKEVLSLSQNLMIENQSYVFNHAQTVDKPH